MSFWTIMNWVAWLLCAVIVILIARDVIKVERDLRRKKAEKDSISSDKGRKI